MESLDIGQTAAYLSRDVREVGKLASRGHLPGRKVNGEWRFIRAEVRHWLEIQLPGYDEPALAALETAHRVADDSAHLREMLLLDTTAVPLVAGTRGSVLRELVKLAEASHLVYDASAVLDAIEKREEMHSTARESGVAIPHAHRPLPDDVLGDAVIAFARTARAVPFGGVRGGMADLFFLVLSKNDRTHLKVMARLARLMLRDDFVYSLRAAETSVEAYELIIAADEDVSRG